MRSVRDHFDGPIEAVVDYSFGNYKFLARRLPGLRGWTADARSRAPQADKHDLSVASYNVETSTR